MKNVTRIILFSIVFVTHYNCYSQINYTRNWCFVQNNWIRFCTGSPQNAGSSSLTGWGEGSASISDIKTGKLLFYTDGITVYDRTHSIMMNGDGLEGELSSAQSALIVPRPGDSLQYYIFTTKDIEGNTGGMYYSVVDMAENSGFGKIIIKNVNLNSTSIEKLTGVIHHNGQDYWILSTAMNNNIFYAYLLTNSGVINPVITYIGSSDQAQQKGGYLKISPDGKYVSSAIFRTNDPSLIGELFRFNDQTGVLTDPVKLNFSEKWSSYGTEFSPNSKMLYFTCSVFGSMQERLLQFNLSTYDSAAINNSLVIIHPSVSESALQLGPDKKIYGLTWPDMLFCINNPDIAGVGCNFNSSALTLTSPVSFGLPNFISSFFDTVNSDTNQQHLLLPDMVRCNKDTLTVTAPQGFQNYTWAPFYNISNLSGQTVNLWPDTTTNYVISAMQNGCTITDTFLVKHVEFTPVNLGPDRTICTDEMPVLVQVGTGFTQYVWNNGATGSSISIDQPGDYSVVAYNTDGCKSSDTISIRNTFCDCSVEMPVAFTPNGDGINDLWKISQPGCLKSFSVFIYNRNGSLVYENSDYKNDWAGTYHYQPLPDGTYYVMAKATFTNGNTKFIKNNLTIIR